MAFANACETGFVHDLGVELARCIPEHADRTSAAGVVPDGRRHDTPLPSHTHHLRHSQRGVLHEKDDQLRQGRVEHRIPERQLLGGCSPHVDAGMPLLRCRDERLRWIDCRYRGRTESFDQLGCQRARATSDVEHSLSRGDRCEIGELRRKQSRVRAHVTVVRVGVHGEAHRRNLRLVLRQTVACGGSWRIGREPVRVRQRRENQAQNRTVVRLTTRSRQLSLRPAPSQLRPAMRAGSLVTERSF